MISVGKRERVIELNAVWFGCGWFQYIWNRAMPYFSKKKKAICMALKFEHEDLALSPCVD
jgi:hypothetical protein